MKSDLHVLVVLAINAKIADANFHYTECEMAKLKQSVRWILTIRMSCKNTRVYARHMQKVNFSDKNNIGRTLYSV